MEYIEYDYNKIIQPMGSPSSTTVEMGVHIPVSQEIMYKPGIMEVLKFALVQYLAIFIPFFWAARQGLSFLFKYRIFEAHLVSDLKPKRKII